MTDELTLQRWAGRLGLAPSPGAGDGAAFTMTEDGRSAPVEFQRRDAGAWDVSVPVGVSSADIARDWAVPEELAQGLDPQFRTPADLFAQEVRQIASIFPMIEARLTNQHDAVIVEFVTALFDEGLNHQSFALTLWNLLHAVDEYERVRSLRARQHDAITRLRAELPGGTFDSAPTPPVVATVASTWTPTHTTTRPAQAWQEPDPTSAHTGTLDARLPVQLLERRGEWAHVVCSNGWSAWIDARDLTVS